MSRPTGSMIDEMFNLREERKKLEVEIKKINEKMTLTEAELIQKLDAEETSMGRGKSASASITKSEVPMVEDWDTFGQYLINNEMLYLLQRRVAVRAFRELKEAGETIPGTTTFPKRTISLRKISK